MTIIDDSSDCEDQGFSALSAGCLKFECQEWIGDKLIHPQLVKRMIHPYGHLEWVCPKCGGCYGSVENE